MRNYDVIIIGAGAAGLMCALTAGQLGKRVLLLDHAEKAGKKILISGGGRCNFTNIHTAPDRFISGNPHFVKSALSRYKAADFIALMNAHNIAYHEKTLGQLFCDGSAKQVVAMLLDECAKGGVEVELGAENIRIASASDGYQISFGDTVISTPHLVIATGGPSIPKMGATGFAYDVARQFNIKIIEPRPALVPFTLGSDQQLFRELSGVATEVFVRCGNVEFREAALFTHKGLSGPAILQISSYWQAGQKIYINFLPNADTDWLRQAKRSTPKSHLRTILKYHLPDRLATALAERIALEGDLANKSDKLLEGIENQLASWIFNPNGTEGFAKAEVTVGGICTSALSSTTLECKSQDGLYFIGEAVDVTGWLGGYNFQWAWSSGWAAAQAL